MNSFFKCIKILTFLSIFLTNVYAKDYIIYGITQNIPMGEENEKVVKNFYVNLGKQQGLKNGTVLDVFRAITVSDPYESKNKYSYKVKIGELKVVHTEEGTSIALLEQTANNTEKIVFDIQKFMIGDKVQVKVQ